MKILLVEDDKQTSDYIAKGLREHGHTDQADNGRDGLYLATGEKYDVMVVDRMLPSMDGLSLVKAARTSMCARRCCSSPPWAASTIAWRASMPAATTIS